MRRSITALISALAALLLTACPDKGAEVEPSSELASPVVEEARPAAEVSPAREPAPRSIAPAKESVCDCTCEGESCRCSPLTWRTGCTCYDDEMKDCTCDCKGETIVSVDEVTAEAIVKTNPDDRIQAPDREALAEEVPPPPPPPAQP